MYDSHVYKKEEDPLAARRVLIQFCDRTTAHGWGRVSREKSRWAKILWALITILAYIINILHISMLVSQFLQFPTEHVAHVEHSAIEFPSITICNIQPMSLSTQREMLQNSSSRYFYWDNITQWYFDTLANKNDSEIYESLYNRLRQPIGYFENIGDEAQKVGHQPFDFVLRCRFSQADCEADNFTFFQDPTYFNCYTFNGGNLSREKLIAKTTGPQNGLSIIFYLECDNGDFMYNGTYYTFSNVGNGAGARVTVHSPNTRPSPIDQGFDIPPGYTSSIGIKVIRNERLNEPYGKCVDDLYWGSEHYVYSSHTCLTLCQQENIMNKCGCISSQLPIPEDQSAGFKYCGTFDPSNSNVFFTNLSCEESVMMEFASSETIREQCKCHSPCVEYSYKTDISYSYWPLDFTQADFYQQYVVNHRLGSELKAYKNLHHINMSQLIFHGGIRKNFARLNVYLKDLTIEEVVQEKSYEIYNLFSDVGGTFGLWIGVSILTWFEMLELLYNIVRNFCEKLIVGMRAAGTLKKVNVYPQSESMNYRSNRISHF